MTTSAAPTLPDATSILLFTAGVALIGGGWYSRHWFRQHPRLTITLLIGGACVLFSTAAIAVWLMLDEFQSAFTK